MSDEFWLLWPTEYKFVTQAFGLNAAYYGQFGLPGHEGLDLRAPNGSKIFAAAAGQVYQVTTAGAYGICVRVDHLNGFKTLYAHLQRALVSVGQSIERGDTVGLADNTGNSTGSHLHFGLKKDGNTAMLQELRKRYANTVVWPFDFIDPMPYLERGLIQPTQPTQPTQLKSPPVPYRVTATWLNMRDAASIQGRIITQLPNGTLVYHLGPTIIGGVWHQIKLNDGRTGWCSGAWLERVAVSELSTVAMYEVTAEPRLNMRSGPGFAYAVIGKLNMGTLVEYLDSANKKWFKVKAGDGPAGWVHSNYLVKK